MGRTPPAAGMAVAIMICKLLGGPEFADANPARPNWGTERGEDTSGAEYEKSKGICRALGAPVAPPGDMPTPARKAALSDCRSEPQYYGEGRPVDYTNARLCAFVEADGGDDRTFGGSSILMQIDLERLLSGKWPLASATAAREADAHLNASYRKTLVWAESSDNMSTIHPDAIRQAQRVWLVYRDAFVRFAAAASPRTGRDALLSRLTNLRNAQLDRMPV